MHLSAVKKQAERHSTLSAMRQAYVCVHANTFGVMCESPAHILQDVQVQEFVLFVCFPVLFGFYIEAAVHSIVQKLLVNL